MRTIHKYPIQIADEQPVEMPICAKVLSVQVQGNQVCLWAEVDTNRIAETRRVFIFGTGRPIPSSLDARYVGTFQIQDGALVFHVYVSM